MPCFIMDGCPLYTVMLPACALHRPRPTSTKPPYYRPSPGRPSPFLGGDPPVRARQDVDSGTLARESGLRRSRCEPLALRAPVNPRPLGSPRSPPYRTPGLGTVTVWRPVGLTQRIYRPRLRPRLLAYMLRLSHLSKNYLASVRMRSWACS